MKILIIEDEYNLADAIKTMLEKKKYDVVIKTDGSDGLDEALTNIYDLIILDVMLPSIDGFEILSEIRREEIDSKVLMLTAKATIEDKLNGLNNGADDYITKPFHMDELLARVNIQLRKNGKDNIITIGNTSLDIDKLILTNNDTMDSVSIIGKEFQLLENFMHNLNQVLDKEQIFNKIWGYDSEVESNSLEAYLSFLRKKLKVINSNLNVKSIRNMGYKLEVMDEKTKD
ncbi:MAG: response regulator transcription factor [Bacilli bacterium]|nr:response regulator transcription factor [Bacilli bacterium]